MYCTLSCRSAALTSSLSMTSISSVSRYALRMSALNEPTMLRSSPIKIVFVCSDWPQTTSYTSTPRDKIFCFSRK